MNFIRAAAAVLFLGALALAGAASDADAQTAKKLEKPSRHCLGGPASKTITIRRRRPRPSTASRP